VLEDLDYWVHKEAKELLGEMETLGRTVEIRKTLLPEEQVESVAEEIMVVMEPTVVSTPILVLVILVCLPAAEGLGEIHLTDQNVLLDVFLETLRVVQ
jgi:hypothetical protein